ncbi:MAG: hypothetical protein ACSNEK_00100 [Parachlamydiaceae bacterium]
MTQTLNDQSTSIDLALNAAIQGMKKEDLETAKCSLNELTSQKNAYTQTQAHVENQQQRWNMITYKKGRKSSL